MPLLPAFVQELQRQLQARELALTVREEALAKQEKAIQRQLAEAQALHSRNLGVRASLEAARSAASAAKAALDTRVQHAQQLIADLRAAQAAAAAAAPAAGAAAAPAVDCGAPAPPQMMVAQQAELPSQQAEPAGTASPTLQQQGTAQPEVPSAAEPPAPQVVAQPASWQQHAERQPALAGKVAHLSAEVRQGTKRKPEAAAAGAADAATAAKRPALEPAHVAPISAKAAASLHATCTALRHAAGADGAAAAGGQRTGLTHARPRSGTPTRSPAEHQGALATNASPGAKLAAAAPPAPPCSMAGESPSAGRQLPAPPPPMPAALPQPTPLPGAAPGSHAASGCGVLPAACGNGQRVPPQHSSSQQQWQSHVHTVQQRAQAKHPQRHPGQQPQLPQCQQQQQQQQQQRRQACPTCPRCRAPLQGGHTKKACKAVRRLRHTCGRCRQRGHWERECAGPAKGGAERHDPKGKRKKGKRAAPQAGAQDAPAAAAAAAAAGGSQGRGHAQHHTASRDHTRSQNAASVKRPLVEVDEEGELDDIVSALRAAQSPPQQQDERRAGPKAAEAGDGSTATEGGAAPMHPLGGPSAGASSPNRQRWRAPQDSCQAALTALKDDAPELLADLRSHQLMPRLAVLQVPPPQRVSGASTTASRHTGQGVSSTAPALGATGDAFSGVTQALERLFPAAAAAQGPASFWCALRASLDEQRSRGAADASSTPSDAADHGSGGGGGCPEGGSSHRAGQRPLAALETLVDLAEEAASRGEPLLWGWCRALRAFVFVFEAAHRIVVEVPEYGHATYFFELESPMPVAAQVQRLVAVLGARGVTKGALLSDAPLDVARLSGGELAALRAAGWAPGAGLRSLLNFSGERIRHYEGPAADGHSSSGSWRQRLTDHLRAGASGGRVHKEPPCTEALQGAWEVDQPAPAGEGAASMEV